MSGQELSAPAQEAAGAAFAELAATSNFTFLVGAAHPEEYVARAAELGLQAVAAADRNTLAGVVRGHVAARDLNKRAAARVRQRKGVTGRDVAERGAQLAVKLAAAAQGEAGPRRKVDASDRATVTAEGPSLSPEIDGWDGRWLTASRLALEDSAVEWIALPTDRDAYGRLCRLLTIGKRRADKGACRLRLADLADWRAGLVLLAAPPDPLAPDPAASSPRAPDQPALAAAAAPGPDPLAPIAAFAAESPGDVFLLARPGYDGRDAERLAAYAALSERLGAPMVATADPLMHRAGRRRLADVLTCIRERLVVDGLGARALPNAERRLRSGAEMARLFADWPAAVARTVAIAARCRFSLDELTYEYPDEVSVDPETGAAADPQDRLERLAWEGLEARYPAETHPEGPPDKVRAQCARELALIKRLDYARYFLTVRDVVAFAESRDILAQGRGSAANSVVCYALRITAISPEIATMVFERFVSEARGEPPDIDVDFEHERREEVIQYVYERYGRSRAGLCATVIHFRARAAIREVGRAMGLSEDVVSAVASQIWGWGDDDVTEARLREIGLDPADRRLRQTLDLVGEIIGFPRHLSQHVGGFVMTRGRLDELCPIENAAMEGRTVIEWDKDDIDALGILKVDVLSLGMLTCVRKCFDLMERHGPDGGAGPSLTLASIPKEDPAVYEMLSEGDSIGVFQVESRAQMNFLPRMKPRSFYDLVIEVAIVRPGPIQGDMVHPYLRRRQGVEEVSFPSGELAEVLGKTLGVPLFQEQAMQIAIVGAGFTPEEADQLRRALATFRKSGTIHTFRERFVQGMIARGYEPDFSERCFSQIEGFGEYGFPESHAASFALLVYASAWLKRWRPDAFACALLNAQPMGFYAPAQIVRDARAHGVLVRPVCVNASFWDNTLESVGAGERSTGGWALRLGFRQIKGLSEDEAMWIAAARGNGYLEVDDVWRRAGVSPAGLERLAEADAFADLGLSRRDALWAAKGVKSAAPLPLFADLLEGEAANEPKAALPRATLGEEVVEDYLSVRLSLRAHPIELLRETLTPPETAVSRSGAPAAAQSPAPPKWPAPPGSLRADQLRDVPDGARITVAGLVIVRQRPGSAKGVIFLTLEDEAGVANVIVWKDVYQRFRRQVIAGRLLRATGKVQRDGVGRHAVTHVVADQIEDISGLLDALAHVDFDNAAAYADEVRRPVMRDPRLGGARSGGPSGRRRADAIDAAAVEAAAAASDTDKTPPKRAQSRAMHPRDQARRLFPSRDFH